MTSVDEFTGSASMTIPLVTIGGVNVQLKYNSGRVYKEVGTENRYAPSGFVGLGWTLLYGSISAEINGSAEVSDDRYFYTGPEGNFQIQQGVDGFFRIPNFKPWRIERCLNDDGIITGWVITKDDGTVMRFGNYHRSNNNCNFSLTQDSTFATRFYLGYEGLVVNPKQGLYSGLSLIPYQWDLSDVEDPGGSHTTIIYRQVLRALSLGGTNSGTYGRYYTRESHPDRILDNKGSEVSFNTASMDAGQFYPYPQSYEQNLVDTLSLSSLYFKTSGTIYRKVVLTYDAMDIFSIGAGKRYLSAISIRDASDNSLPSYKLSYYSSQSDVYPGALKSFTSPQGGKSTFTYKTQSLSNFHLLKLDSVDALDYWDPGNFMPKDDGLAGKDFVVVRDVNQRLTVYRRGTTGWYADTQFPCTFASYSKVYNDYVVLEDDSIRVVKRTDAGWKVFNVTEKIGAHTGLVSGVVGVAAGYFVVKYDGPSNQTSGLLYQYKVAIVNLEANAISAQFLGYYLDGIGNISQWTLRGVSMKAFCGENYTVLASADNSISGYGTTFTHFKRIGGTWNNVKDRSELQAGSDLYMQTPHRVYIGRNFLVCAFIKGDLSTEFKVYRHTGAQPEILTDINLGHRAHDVVVGDDYFAYTYEIGTGNVNQMTIRTWNGTSFSSTDFESIFSGDERTNFQLSAMDNRLLVSYLSMDETPSLWKLAVTSYSPTSRSWSTGQIVDVVPDPTGSLTGLGACWSAGVALDATTFLNVWYLPYNDGTQHPPCPFILRAYKFHGNSFKTSKVDSLLMRYAVHSAGFNVEDPRYWVWQPGDNFFALSRPFYSQPRPSPHDPVHIYSFNEAPDGSLQFNNSQSGAPPTVLVVDRKTVENGIGENATRVYSFPPSSGVINQYMTTEYGTVIETLPGNNGSIRSMYYTSKDSLGSSFNFRHLAGMVYSSKEYNNNGTVVRETQNTWNAVAVDPLNGVFSIQLSQQVSLTDGVASSISYYYGDAVQEYQLSRTEETNNNGIKRITRFRYPLDYQTTSATSSDAMVRALHAMKGTKHMLDAVVEKSVVQEVSGSQQVVASDLTLFKEYSSNQILPSQQLKLRTNAPVGNFTASSSSSSAFTYDNRYVPVQTIDAYDSHGNVLQATDGNGYSTVTAWGYNSSMPVATVRNAGRSNVSVSVFDDNDKSKWNTTYGSWSVQKPPFQDAQTSFLRQSDNNTTSPWDLPCVNSSASTANGVFEADVRFNTSTGQYLAVGKYLSLSSFVRFELRKSSGAAVITAMASGQTVSKSGSFTFSQSRWYHLTGIISGTAASLYIDGRPVVQFSHPLVSMGAGSIALYTYRADAGFDNVRMYPLNALAVSQSYHPLFLLPNAKTGTDGNVTNFYVYDSFGRLSSIKDHSGTTIKSYSYYYSRAGNNDNFSSVSPNYTAETSYRSSTESTVSKNFFDGLGRTWEKQTSTGGGNNIISYATYDVLDRVSRTYKPFEYASNGNFFIDFYGEEVKATASGYYNNNVYGGVSDNSPFSLREYFDAKRLKIMRPEGSAWQNGHYISYSYGKNSSGEVSDYSENTLNSTTTIDENQNNIRRIDYRDKFGNLVQTTVDASGQDEMKTRFVYDISGNLVTTFPPQTSIGRTEYAYNTLNQLKSRTSPDAGTTSFLYDRNGNLRFVKDANHAGPSGGFVYYKYDAMNRVLETGEMPGSSSSYFTQEYADICDFPYAATTRQTLGVNSYDNPSQSSQQNVRGRLASAVVWSAGLPIETAYSYDAMGRVSCLSYYFSYLPGRPSPIQVKYWYDLQGNVTKKGFVDASDIGNTLYTLYGYDAAGRLSTVSTAQAESGASAVVNARYAYFASGKLKRLQLGNAQGVDYRYNERDWLSSINHQNLNSSDDPGHDGSNGIPVDRFGEVVGYNVPAHIGGPSNQNATAQFNGNISWLIYQMNNVSYSGSAGTTSLVGWTYSYDRANRLTKGDFGYYVNGWQQTNAFDLYNLTYDGSGNIKTLARFGSNAGGAPVDYLTYNYVGGTNKLANIKNAVLGNSPQSYSYDANGNITYDYHHGISSVVYNVQNLPEQMVKSGSTFKYSYDANGNRIRKQAGSVDELYILGKDGETEAVFETSGMLKFWNILAGTESIGRIEKK